MKYCMLLSIFYAVAMQGSDPKANRKSSRVIAPHLVVCIRHIQIDQNGNADYVSACSIAIPFAPTYPKQTDDTLDDRDYRRLKHSIKQETALTGALTSVYYSQDSGGGRREYYYEVDPAQTTGESL